MAPMTGRRCSGGWPRRRGPDLGVLASSVRALAAAGADGMIVACPDDPARIAAIGQVLAESFPG
jgi:hypothetical protein